MGAMLYVLGGGSPQNPSDFYGRKISSAVLENDVLTLKFEDGTAMRFWDGAQSCCESRYVTCDDDLSKLVGGELRNIEVKEGPCEDGEGDYGDCHEQAFVEVATNECFVTLCTHNVHNGYYGGFGLCVEEVKGELQAEEF
jgi:hypothetical protein